MPDAVERRVKYFKDDDGSEPVKDWLGELKKQKKLVELTKIRNRIDRAGKGNFGDCRFLAGGFGELKIDFGPGYRLYFGLHGEILVVLLQGGTKKSQQADIELAKERWEKFQNENG